MMKFHIGRAVVKIGEAHLEVTHDEAMALRDRLLVAYPPPIGPWRARKAGQNWCVDRDVPGKSPQVAAAHCKNQTMAAIIAELLNTNGVEW